MSDKNKCLCAIGVAVFALIITLLAEAQAGEYRIGVMPNSNHFNDDDHHYNEDHQGIFVEKRFGKTWYGYMNYDNSFADNSNAYYFGRTLGGWKFIETGYQMGVVTGYAVDPAPYGLLTFTFSFNQHLKARIALLPIVEGNQYLVEF
jgi:hypothetical protein